uniref:Protein kinase domain-containing protein n=1 Tax=Glossina palpalis gambiensis TaxID=67801 RepID=A0A1B0APD6_9MUSC
MLWYEIVDETTNKLYADAMVSKKLFIKHNEDMIAVTIRICQTIQGVKYLHDNRVIDRNLKLRNPFLDDMCHVKIIWSGYAY